jgi:hypothetical protein
LYGCVARVYKFIFLVHVKKERKKFNNSYRIHIILFLFGSFFRGLSLLYLYIYIYIFFFNRIKGLEIGTNSLTPGHVYTKGFCLRFGCVLLSRGLMYVHTFVRGRCKPLNTRRTRVHARTRVNTCSAGSAFLTRKIKLNDFLCIPKVRMTRLYDMYSVYISVCKHFRVPHMDPGGPRVWGDIRIIWIPRYRPCSLWRVRLIFSISSPFTFFNCLPSSCTIYVRKCTDSNAGHQCRVPIVKLYYYIVVIYWQY